MCLTMCFANPLICISTMYGLDDKGFALNYYIMTPFQGNPDSGTLERVFNCCYSRAHSDGKCFWNIEFC